ncbi:MAG: YqgE/AlgH family protein [Gammaproteobacteria bacterium]|nr:YqgE/AlgH family protein [Gammaproteobacteria bacterium]
MKKASSTESTQGESLRNHFLLAMPTLTDAIFAHSITYLCEHNEHGAMGIVINHPLEVCVEEILMHLQISADGRLRDIPVMAGGPVHMDRGFVLHRHTVREWEASLKVTDEIYLTTSRDILAAIAVEEGPEHNLIALGYAGWAAGQLEAEITDNSWLTLPADSAIIFDTPYQQRATAAAANLGVDLNLISGEAGHA